MRFIGRINDRDIFYSRYEPDSGCLDDLPSKDWLLVPIGDKKDVELYSLVAEKCLENEVAYVCALGRSCEFIHDIFDETVVSSKIEAGLDDFDGNPMTTWHHNFSDGFWFASMLASTDDKDIEKLVCLDFTERGVERHLRDLAEKIANGWLPSDADYEDPVYDM